MRALLLALVLAAVGASGPVAAEVAPAAERCDAPNRTADQIAACMQSRIDAADRGMTSAYRAAMSGLDGESRTRLQAAQRAWISFREADIAANNGPWRQKRGLQIRMAAMTNTITALREREAELRRLYLAP